MIFDPQTRLAHDPTHSENLHILLALPLPFIMVKLPMKTFKGDILASILVLTGVFYLYGQKVGIMDPIDLLYFYLGLIPAYMIYFGLMFYRMKKFSDSMLKKIDRMRF